MEALAPYRDMLVITLGVIILAITALVIYRAFNRTIRGRKGARLGVSEYFEIDKTRRLLLVRRDDVEHLVLIGGPQDVVIEPGIEPVLMTAPAMPAPPPQPSFQANQPQLGGNVQPMRTQPRPAVFGERRPPLRPVEPVANPQRVDDADN
jgi:hypothetical protein